MKNVPEKVSPIPFASPPERRLTRPEFQALAEVPPELEWFANIENDRNAVEHNPVDGVARPKEGTLPVLQDYLKAAGHGQDLDAPLFQPVRNPRTRALNKPLNPASIYRNVVLHYAKQVR
jgi:hypothetical protein